MSPRLQGPRVAVPPPLLFVGGWVVAWMLNRRLPFEIDGSGASAAQELFGTALVVAGLLITAWGLATFAHAGTAILPVRPARVLVTHGPYRFSRNPMYVGVTGAYSGLAVLLNQAWPLVLLPVVLAGVSVLVIRREERYLQMAFPETYVAYTRRVRRWV